MKDDVQDTAISSTPAPSQPTSRQSNPPAPDRTRVVARPTPKTQTEDPRTFQINQIQRRFKPSVSEQDATTVMTFNMKPSDPDFPYDVEEFECALSVPAQYPTSGKPSLTIKNKEIPRGFQINIERGFDSIAGSAPQATLLSLMNRLDKQLEAILGGQIAETVKIVPNKGPLNSQQTDLHRQPPLQKTTQLPIAREQAPTPQQLDEARTKRQSDVRQLEARFSRLQLYAKSADGMTYTVPLDSPKRSTWPEALQPLKSAQLVVPKRYPLETTQLRLNSESAEARAVETAFKKHAEEKANATLTQQINYLSQHLKGMATSKPTPVPEPTPIPDVATSSEGVRSNLPSTEGDDKSHVHHIPRPPEWDAVAGPDDSEDSESNESDYETGDEDKDASEEPDLTGSIAPAPAERGILLSFPQLEMHGIELLELISLNIIVKCERCKDTMDIERLRHSAETAKMREESCKKCATTFAVRFRADMIHVNSVRAGYLDLDGCTVVDMLPRYTTPCQGPLGDDKANEFQQLYPDML